jgi:hypothetical protein
MAVIRVGDSEVVSVSDAAALLEVSEHQVRVLLRRGRLVRRGDVRPALIDRVSVERYKRERGFWPRYGVRGGLPAVARRDL